MKLFFLMTLLTSTVFACAQCHCDDFYSLQDLYNGTQGNNWYENTNWNVVAGSAMCDSTANLSSLFGITYNANNRVSRIFLLGNNINGQIPPSIGNILELEQLVFGGDSLFGEIPSEMGQLSLLESFAATHCKLSGPIPQEFGNLTSLAGIALWDNNLSGPIPTSLGNLSQLLSFRLAGNQLTGSLPTSLGQLNSLVLLDVSHNTMSGCFSTDLLILCDQLGSNSTNARISEGNNFNATWEDFCTCNAGICPCNETNIWQGGIDNWNIAANWSLGHVPRACEAVQITNVTDIVTVPVGEYPVIYLLDVSNGAELIVPAGQMIYVLADPEFSGWNVCD